MSNRKFSAVEKEAIWKAYGGKCTYTTELLNLDGIHIDHIIPEKYLKLPQEFEIIKNRLKLPIDFEINGWENLLPCQPSANLRKGDTLFDDSKMQYFLGIAGAKKEIVQENIRKIESSLNSGKAAIKIQQSLEKNLIKPSEIAAILEKYNDHPEQIVKLLESLELKDTEPLNEVQKRQIAELKASPIKFGKNDHIDFLELTNEMGQKLEVRSCDEYEWALQEGYFAYTNYDIKMSVYFEHQCGLLNAINNSQRAKKSYVSHPHRGITDLSLIPFSLFPNIGDEEINVDEKKSYQDAINSEDLFVRRVTHSSITIEDEGMGQYLVEVARSDFNGDGFEDLLLYEYCYAVKGTLGYGGVRLLTRKSENSMFEIVSMR